MRVPLSRGAALALVLTLATAAAAAADPAFAPNRLPAGEAVDAVLVVSHGCGAGTSAEGTASPTVRFDLHLSAQVTALDAHETEGWEVEQEDGVVRWTATDGGTAEPIELPVTLTIDGPPDEPFHLTAFQECEEGSLRWTGTPDEAAEHPAVTLTPTAGEIGTDVAEDAHVEDGHVGDDHADDDAADDHAHDPAEDPGTSEAASEVAPPNDGARATAESGVSWVVIGVVLLVLVAGAAVLRRRAD